VHYESLPAIHTTLERFEGELLNTVPHEYKELLRVNLDGGCKLGVRRLLRTATAVFDSEDPSDREAVFYAEGGGLVEARPPNRTNQFKNHVPPRPQNRANWYPNVRKLIFRG
jgi:hypothetical protein